MNTAAIAYRMSIVISICLFVSAVGMSVYHLSNTLQANWVEMAEAPLDCSSYEGDLRRTCDKMRDGPSMFRESLDDHYYHSKRMKIWLLSAFAGAIGPIALFQLIHWVVTGRKWSGPIAPPPS